MTRRHKNDIIRHDITSQRQQNYYNFPRAMHGQQLVLIKISIMTKGNIWQEKGSSHEELVTIDTWNLHQC